MVWRPLAQLSYGFYINSAIVTAYRLFSIRQTTTLSAENMFRTIVSDAVVCFFLAYLIHIMIQQPMKNIRSILINWRVSCDEKQPSACSSLPLSSSPKVDIFKSHHNHSLVEFHGNCIESNCIQLCADGDEQLNISTGNKEKENYESIKLPSNDETDFNNNNINNKNLLMTHHDP